MLHVIDQDGTNDASVLPISTVREPEPLRWVEARAVPSIISLFSGNN
ncbi:hypothetical protein [Pseudomonas syringae]|nr:hypothetical protein [Pseudomonas syringae]